MANHRHRRPGHLCAEYCCPGHASIERMAQLLGANGEPAGEAEPAAGARRRRR